MTKEKEELEKLKKQFEGQELVLMALESAFHLGWKEGHKTMTTDDWVDLNA